MNDYLAGFDCQRRDTRGLDRAGEQEVFCRGWLKPSVIRSSQDCLCARYEIGDADPWAKFILMNKQLVVVVPDAGIQREVLERSKAVLNERSDRGT
jgi:hypothetical protein